MSWTLLHRYGAAFSMTALLAAAVQASPQQLRVSGDRLFVPVVVNGVTVEALLDSGAEMSLVDITLAERLWLALTGNEMARGTGGEQPVQFAEQVELRAAGVALSGRTVAVLDLSDVSRRLVGEPVMLVLGRELFDSGRFLLDIEEGRFEPVGDDHVPLGVVVPLRDHHGIKQMPVTVEGVAVQADFDLGNGSEMLVGRPLADARGWRSPDRLIGTRSGGGLGGPVQRDLVRLETVSLAGTSFRDVVAAVDATVGASDANLGVSLLRRFVLTIDFPRDRLWLEPRPRGRQTPVGASGSSTVMAGSPAGVPD